MDRRMAYKGILAGSVRSFRLNSVFIRMLSVSFGIFLVLCLINYIGIRVQTQQALDNEKRNSEFYVDYSYSYLDKLMNKLEEYMYSIEYDSNVIYLRTLPKGSNYAVNYTEVNNAVNRLKIFRLLVSEISTVYIYLPNIDRIFTSEGEYEPETFFRLNYNGDYGAWKRMLTQKYMYTFNIWEYDTAPHDLSNLNLVKSFFEGQGSKCVIVANLSRDLVKQLYQDNDYVEERKIYITDKKPTILSSNIDGEAGKALELDRDTLAKSDKGSYFSGDTLVTYRYLPEEGIYFVAMTPKDVIFRNVNNLTVAAYTVLAIMLVLSIVMSVLLSQRFYMPIGQMLKDMERFAAVSMGLSGRQNEYDYIKKNIQSLYANNEKLESVIRESIPFVIDIIIMKALQGGQEVENAKRLAQQYNIDFKPGYYVASILKSARSYAGIPQKTAADIISRVKQGLGSDTVSVLKLRDDEIVLISNIDGSDVSVLAERCEQFCEALEAEYEEERFYFGIGSVADSLYAIEGSALAARLALDGRSVQDNGKVICPGSGGIQKEGAAYLPANFEERYRNAIKAGNIEMTEDLLYEILDGNYSRNPTFAAYHKLCLWIHGITERVTDELRDSEKPLPGDTMEELDTPGDIHELNERLLRNNRLICTAFMSTKRSDSILNQILQYVDDNFKNNINLDSVAYAFKYNPSYLSRLFKQTISISFTDYLGKRRIDYAKTLLGNQSGTIKDIAEESGYNSTGIFIKAFEKQEGVTPGEYRKRMKHPAKKS